MLFCGQNTTDARLLFSLPENSTTVRITVGDAAEDTHFFFPDFISGDGNVLRDDTSISIPPLFA